MLNLSPTLAVELREEVADSIIAISRARNVGLGARLERSMVSFWTDCTSLSRAVAGAKGRIAARRMARQEIVVIGRTVEL